MLLEKIDKNVIYIIEEFGKDLIDQYKSAIHDFEIDASGELSSTAQYSKTTSTNNGYNIVLLLKEYWQYVEYGRKEGSFPPVDSIRQWINDKNIIAMPYEVNGEYRIPTNEQLAFLIGRKIFEKGIEPRPILQESVDLLLPEFQLKLATALSEDIRQDLEKIFN